MTYGVPFNSKEEIAKKVQVEADFQKSELQVGKLEWAIVCSGRWSWNARRICVNGQTPDGGKDSSRAVFGPRNGQ